MKTRKLAMAVAAVATALLSAQPVQAAEASDCTQGYLVCLNDASQESGWLWRTASEVECGIEYFGCLRQKASGE